MGYDWLQRPDDKTKISSIMMQIDFTFFTIPQTFKLVIDTVWSMNLAISLYFTLQLLLDMAIWHCMKFRDKYALIYAYLFHFRDIG